MFFSERCRQVSSHYILLGVTVMHTSVVLMTGAGHFGTRELISVPIDLLAILLVGIS